MTLIFFFWPLKFDGIEYWLSIPFYGYLSLTLLKMIKTWLRRSIFALSDPQQCRREIAGLWHLHLRGSYVSCCCWEASAREKSYGDRLLLCNVDKWADLSSSFPTYFYPRRMEWNWSWSCQPRMTLNEIDLSVYQAYRWQWTHQSGGQQYHRFISLIWTFQALETKALC